MGRKKRNGAEEEERKRDRKEETEEEGLQGSAGMRVNECRSERAVESE